MLTDKIIKAVHEDIPKINSQLEQKATKQEVEIERKRITNIVSNNNPTEGNSELIDIRVGADGKTYSGAGEAIRSQFLDIKNYNYELEEVYLGYIKWVNGVISGNIITENSARLATENTFVADKLVSVNARNGYEIRVAVYDKAGLLLGYYPESSHTNSIFIKDIRKKYQYISTIRIQMKKVDGTDLSPDVGYDNCIVISHKNTNELERQEFYINALSIGFKNDGTTDNTNALNNYFQKYSHRHLYFPKGIYRFNSAIVIENGCRWKLDGQAVIKFNPYIGFVGGAFVTIKDPNHYRGWYIDGGTIDASNAFNEVVALGGVQYLQFINSVLKNATFAGIKTATSSNIQDQSHGLYMKNCYIWNEKENKGATGIYDNSYDNTFVDIGIRNFTFGVLEGGGGTYDHIHPWLEFASMIDGSCAYLLSSSTSRFHNCVADTYQRGVKSRGNNEHFLFTATNFTFFINTNVYTKEVAKVSPPVVFQKTVMSSTFTSYPLLHVHGLSINNTGYEIKLADFEEFPSDIKNKIWCSGVSQSDFIKNDNFTAEKRLAKLELLNNI